MSRRPGLGAVLFFALLAATVAAAVLVVRARTPDLRLEVTELTRVVDRSPGGPPDRARISFFVRSDEPGAVVAIVDSREDVIRTLDASRPLEAGEEVSYVWDGTTDAGGPAPPGRYRLLVVLPDSDHEMVWPRRITLDGGGDG